MMSIGHSPKRSKAEQDKINTQIDDFLKFKNAPGRSERPTRYAVSCPRHGCVFLTYEEFERQTQSDGDFCCPCGLVAPLDEERLENFDNEPRYRPAPGKVVAVI